MSPLGHWATSSRSSPIEPRIQSGAEAFPPWVRRVLRVKPEEKYSPAEAGDPSRPCQKISTKSTQKDQSFFRGSCSLKLRGGTYTKTPEKECEFTHCASSRKREQGRPSSTSGLELGLAAPPFARPYIDDFSWMEYIHLMI